MDLITKLSGLLKAITYTIRVICRVNFKTVLMYENFVIRFLISLRGREGLFITSLIFPTNRDINHGLY